MKEKQILSEKDKNSIVYSLPDPASTSVVRFAQGIRLFFGAGGFLLRNPRNLLLIILPLALNLFIFVVLIAWGFGAFAHTLDAYLKGHSGWYWSTITITAKILFWPIILLVVYFIFTPVALLIASPFNDYLAERVERACGFSISESTGSPLRRIVTEISFVIFSEGKRLIFCGFIFLILFCLNFIPIIGNAVYLVLGTYWAVRCMAFEFISYASDRRRLTFGDKWHLLRRNWALSVGFGAVATLLFLIPFLNVLVVPICAVGGTFLFGIMQSGGEKPAGQRANQSGF